MQLEQSAQIRKPLPLTPLVDIVFLLLMFFMLTSSFTKFGNLNLGSAGFSRQTTATTAPPKLILRISHGPRMVVNGNFVELRDLPQVLNTFLDKGIKSAVLVSNNDATVQDLVSVLEMARTSRLQNIVVAK